MSDCDCQKNIKIPMDDGSTVEATAAKKPIGDGSPITTVAATVVGIFWPKDIRRRAVWCIINIYVVGMV